MTDNNNSTNINNSKQPKVISPNTKISVGKKIFSQPGRLADCSFLTINPYRDWQVLLLLSVLAFIFLLTIHFLVYRQLLNGHESAGASESNSFEQVSIDRASALINQREQAYRQLLPVSLRTEEIIEAKTIFAKPTTVEPATTTPQLVP